MPRLAFKNAQLLMEEKKVMGKAISNYFLLCTLVMETDGRSNVLFLWAFRQ